MLLVSIIPLLSIMAEYCGIMFIGNYSNGIISAPDKKW